MPPVVAAMLAVGMLVGGGVISWRDDCLKGTPQAWDTLFWFGILISMSLSLQEHGVVGAFTGWASARLDALALPWPALFAALHVQVRARRRAAGGPAGEPGARPAPLATTSIDGHTVHGPAAMLPLHPPACDSGPPAAPLGRTRCPSYRFLKAASAPTPAPAQPHLERQPWPLPQPQPQPQPQSQSQHQPQPPRCTPPFPPPGRQFFLLHYLFASQTAHVGALYAAFLSLMIAGGERLDCLCVFGVGVGVGVCVVCVCVCVCVCCMSLRALVHVHVRARVPRSFAACVHAPTQLRAWRHVCVAPLNGSENSTQPLPTHPPPPA